MKVEVSEVPHRHVAASPLRDAVRDDNYVGEAIANFFPLFLALRSPPFALSFSSRIPAASAQCILWILILLLFL